MSIPIIIFIVALVLALVHELQSEPAGRSVLGWAVVLICAGLLWGRIG